MERFEACLARFARDDGGRACPLQLKRAAFAMTWTDSP